MLDGMVTEAALLTAVSNAPAARTTEAALLVVYKAAKLSFGRVTEEALLVAHSNDAAARSTEAAMLVAYSTGVGGLVRSRAWTYTLDGHTFYVLNLADEGTFVFDDSTGQWAQFQTGGYGIWNMLNGISWNLRVVGGDAIYPTVWQLTPDGVFDDGWRPIEHKVNGGIPSRSQDGRALDAFFLTISAGTIAEDGALLQMRFSDNQGKTWSAYYDIPLTEADYSQNIAWRSLGQITAPGRIFEIRDVGGMIRLDDANAIINGEDDG